MTTDLVAKAKAGDEQAFQALVEPYRRELQVHCYRILGSAHDSEDAMQEILLAAWQGLGGFEERASIRTWLYRVATNRCLDALRAATRRPSTIMVAAEFEPPEPTRFGEVLWLEPYPDDLLADPRDAMPGPEARFETRESISLAFITALQLLPPRQRVVLILRDVLGFRAREVADMLGATEESVTSALKRARATLQSQTSRESAPATLPDSAEERKLIARLTVAYENGDVDGIVALLTDDVWFKMPPLPLEYQGRELAARFLRAVPFSYSPQYRLVWTRANGQPTFATYVEDRHGAVWHATGLMVLTLRGNLIAAMTHFNPGVLAHFGLPRTLNR